MDAMQSQKPKLPSKIEVRAIAVLLFGIGLYVLGHSARAWFNRDWLNVDQQAGADVIQRMKGCIYADTFGIDPSLAILLNLAARLLWRVSKILGNADAKSKQVL